MLTDTPADLKDLNMHRRDFLKYSAAVGAFSALPLWSRAALAADLPALPVPDLLAPDARNSIRLTVQSGKTAFGANSATTWGYNGKLLGPALRLTQNEAVTVDIYNSLAEETTVHWHGLEVPGEVDGGPAGRDCRGRQAQRHIYSAAAGGDVLVPSSSARENRPSGGHGACRVGVN